MSKCLVHRIPRRNHIQKMLRINCLTRLTNQHFSFYSMYSLLISVTLHLLNYYRNKYLFGLLCANHIWSFHAQRGRLCASFKSSTVRFILVLALTWAKTGISSLGMMLVRNSILILHFKKESSLLCSIIFGSDSSWMPSTGRWDVLLTLQK